VTGVTPRSKESTAASAACRAVFPSHLGDHRGQIVCAPSLLGQYSNHVELIVARHANKEKLCKRKIVLFNFTGYPREIDQINIRYGDKTRCISAGIFLLIPLR
jgi:hypothetical protein